MAKFSDNMGTGFKIVSHFEYNISNSFGIIAFPVAILLLFFYTFLTYNLRTISYFQNLIFFI